MIVAVTAIGDVGSPTLNGVESCVREQMRAHCVRDAVAEPENAFDAARGQYSSPLFLQALSERATQKNWHVLGVTQRDLFIPMLTFVFGQAQLDGRIAVVSTARLRPEFYGFPGDEKLFSDRLEKEVAHEMGHTLGLIHCPDRVCVMSLSTSIMHVDRKRRDFCDSCRRVLDERLTRMESNEATLADSGCR